MEYDKGMDMSNGLEKILQRIEEDCKAECEEILKRAEEEVKRINQETVEAANRQKDEMLKKAETELSNKVSLAKKANQLEKRNSILQAKNEYIDEVISIALERVRNYDDTTFLALIKDLILKYSVVGAGVIHFSEKDTKRVSSDFIEMINKELKPLNKSISPGKPANIEDGFILEYRDIDVNCTFGSLLSTYEDEIREKVYNELFGG